MLTRLLGINPKNSLSEVRGKLADALLAEGFDREQVFGILAAKKSQHYIDLQNAYRLSDSQAHQAQSAFGSPLTAAG